MVQFGRHVAVLCVVIIALISATQPEVIKFPTQLVQTFHNAAENAPSPHPLVLSASANAFNTMSTSTSSTTLSKLHTIPTIPHVKILSRTSSTLQRSSTTFSTTQSSAFHTMEHRSQSNNGKEDQLHDKLSVFHRLSLYESFLRSQHAHEKRLAAFHDEHQQHVVEHPESPKDERTANHHTFSLPSNPPSSPSRSAKTLRYPRHRTLRHFAQLSVQQQRDTLLGDEHSSERDTGYVPSRLLHKFSPSEINELPPVAITFTSISQPERIVTPISSPLSSLSPSTPPSPHESLFNPLIKASKKHTFSVPNSIRSSNSAQQPSPSSPAKKVERTIQTAYTLDLQRHDTLFSENFTYQPTPSDPHFNATPIMYHHYQGFLAITQSTLASNLVTNDNDDLDLSKIPSKSASMDTFSSILDRITQFSTFSSISSPASTQSGGEHVVCSLSGLDGADVVTFRDKMKKQSRCTSFEPDSSDSVDNHDDRDDGVYHSIAVSNPSTNTTSTLQRHSNAQMTSRNGENTQGRTLLESLRFGSNSPPSQPLNPNTHLQTTLTFQHHKKTAKKQPSMTAGKASSPFSSSIASSHTTLSASDLDQVHLATDQIDDQTVQYDRLIDNSMQNTINQNDEDSSDSSSSFNPDDPSTWLQNEDQMEKTRLLAVAASIHPNGTLTGQAFDSHGMYDFLAVPKSVEVNLTEKNDAFEYSTDGMNSLLLVNSDWIITLSTQKPMPGHGEHSQPHEHHHDLVGDQDQLVSGKDKKTTTFAQNDDDGSVISATDGSTTSLQVHTCGNEFYPKAKTAPKQATSNVSQNGENSTSLANSSDVVQIEEESDSIDVYNPHRPLSIHELISIPYYPGRHSKVDDRPPSSSTNHPQSTQRTQNTSYQADLTASSTTTRSTLQATTPPKYPITAGVVEMGVANDWWRVNIIGGPTAPDLYNSVARIVNVADSLYNRAAFDPPLRVSIATIVNPMTAINKPFEIDLTTNDGVAEIADASQYLDAFMSWSTTNLQTDGKMMLSGLGVKGTVIGLAVLGRMCQSQSSGMVQAIYTEQESFVGTVFAHELGHQIGILHTGDESTVDDTAEGTVAKCPMSSPDIMSATASRPPATQWSPCSFAYYHNWLSGNNYATCLATRSAATISGSTCGNGILEIGETCDCGPVSSCSDPCCEASTCQLKAGSSYECSDQSSPCCKDCKVLSSSATKICRDVTNAQCDEVEYCDGASALCPKNVVKPVGTSCALSALLNSTKSGSTSTTQLIFPGLCYLGSCFSYELTCAQQGGVPCPFLTPLTQCINSLCLSYAHYEIYRHQTPAGGEDSAESGSITIENCFDPFANLPKQNITTPVDSSDATGTNSPTIATATTPNGIPCAANQGQCLQFQCIATTALDPNLVTVPGGSVLGMAPIAIVILSVSAGIVVIAVVVCCFFLRRRAKKKQAMLVRDVVEPLNNDYGGSGPSEAEEPFGDHHNRNNGHQQQLNSYIPPSNPRSSATHSTNAANDGNVRENQDHSQRPRRSTISQPQPRATMSDINSYYQPTTLPMLPEQQRQSNQNHTSQPAQHRRDSQHTTHTTTTDQHTDPHRRNLNNLSQNEHNERRARKRRLKEARAAATAAEHDQQEHSDH